MVLETKMLNEETCQLQQAKRKTEFIKVLQSKNAGKSKERNTDTELQYILYTDDEISKENMDDQYKKEVKASLTSFVESKAGEQIRKLKKAWLARNYHALRAQEQI